MLTISVNLGVCIFIGCFNVTLLVTCSDLLPENQDREFHDFRHHFNPVSSACVILGKALFFHTIIVTTTT